MDLVKGNIGYVNVQPAGRWSALHQAAEAGHADAVKFLVNSGANLAAKTKDGKTPWDVAKASVKDLLKSSSKRTAPDSGSPVLHLMRWANFKTTKRIAL